MTDNVIPYNRMEAKRAEKQVRAFVRLTPDEVHVFFEHVKAAFTMRMAGLDAKPNRRLYEQLTDRRTDT